GNSAPVQCGTASAEESQDWDRGPGVGDPSRMAPARSRPRRTRQARPQDAAGYRAYRSRCRVPEQQAVLAGVTPQAYGGGQRPPDNPASTFPTTTGEATHEDPGH